MQAQATSAAVCPECGTRLEGGFSRGLGRCMICLLRVGFDDAEEPYETLFAPVTDRLGNYRIERRDDGSLWELGHGAMGVTYRAVDTSLKRPVALKLIDSEWAKRGAEARERFMREARTAASLRHPNVATVYHFGIREENGQCFCAMELVEGETLEMRVRRTGPLDALTTIDIALQVSSALAAAEKQGLVHRDLKPANLMFVVAAADANDSSPGKAEKADTVVKVIDFGVPTKPPCVKPIASGFSTSAFATPKSITFTTVSAFSALPGFESFASGAAATNIKFAGFKSRCTRPCYSAAASALMTCKAMSMVVSASSGPVRRTCISSVSPSTSSIAQKHWPFSSRMPKW
jgi:serine/threonine protein kinase